jgi:sugar phosphate isomerase/epimerase
VPIGVICADRRGMLKDRSALGRTTDMMTRRTFVQQASLLASTVLGVPTLAASPYKMGLQLFTLRAAMAQDAPGTLKRVADLGYEEVETYGFDDRALRYYGMEASAFKELLAANKLTTSSGHYDLNRFVVSPLGDLERYVDRCIEGARALGQSYITWPWLDEQSRTIEKFKVVAERLNIAGKRIKSAGLQLAYHNHDFEFVEQDGRIGYDIVTQDTDSNLVKLQMDLYWIARASKLTPHQWFEKFPGRFVMWHVKDMHRTSRDYTELGNGTIDFPAIWPDVSLAGLKHYFVEQGGNFTHDPFRSVADSAAYVRRVLLK